MEKSVNKEKNRKERLVSFLLIINKLAFFISPALDGAMVNRSAKVSQTILFPNLSSRGWFQFHHCP